MCQWSVREQLEKGRVEANKAWLNPFSIPSSQVTSGEFFSEAGDAHTAGTGTQVMLIVTYREIATSS